MELSERAKKEREIASLGESCYTAAIRFWNSWESFVGVHRDQLWPMNFSFEVLVISSATMTRVASNLPSRDSIRL